MSDWNTEIDYKAHILIGVRADGVMSVIDDWPHVPSQDDVDSAIDATRGLFMAFALCTPTSILPGRRTVEAPKAIPTRFGTLASNRQP